MSASVQDFHSQIASIMEMLANTAVAEICKVVDDGYAVVNLEVSRSQKENEFLRRRIKVLELQISRYRAERLKSPAEGSFCSRYTGVRLLQHRQGRDTPTGLQNRNRFLNRAPQRTSPIILDQDPAQEVATKTQAEPIESEDDSELVIVKVEGNTSINDTTPNLSATIQEPHKEVSASSKAHDGNRTPTHCYKGPQTNKDVIVFDVSVSTDSALEQKIKSEKQDGKKWLPLQIYSDETPGTSSDATTFINNSLEITEQSSNMLPNLNILRQNLQSSSFNSSQTSETNLDFYQAANVELSFGCGSCPKRFFSERELNRHKLSHARHKPYQCFVCGKGFVCKSQLDVHGYVHTGERPFPCPLCPKRFSHPSNLRRHQKLQH